MPNTSLEDALKEAYALAPNDQVVLDTIEVSYIGLSETLYLVQDRDEWDLTLEGSGGVKTFKPCGFRFIAPTAGKEGIQQMSLAIDNVGAEVSDFFNALGELTEPVKVTYRPYLSTDTTQPQMDPPLVLFLVDVQMTTFEISGRATFTSIVNTKYPTQYYSAQRFPGLVGRGGNVLTPPSSAFAWDVSRLSFTDYFDLSSEVATNFLPTDIFIQPGGLRMFVAMKNKGVARSGTIQSYTLSTAWDVTTATAESSLTIPADIEGVTFKPDGTKMYISDTDVAGQSFVDEYNLVAPWNLTTATFYQKKQFPDGALYFRENGVKLFIAEGIDITSYDLSTAWDISTMVEDTSYTELGKAANGVAMRDDGSRIFWTSLTGGEGYLYQSNLSIAYDLSTAVYDDFIKVGLDTVSVDMGPNGVHWKPDGLAAYVVRNGESDTFEVYQYDIV